MSLIRVKEFDWPFQSNELNDKIPINAAYSTVGGKPKVFTNTENNVHIEVKKNKEQEMQTHQNMAISAANRHNVLYYFISFLAVTLF